MINLFENYSQGSWDLHYSLIVAGYVNDNSLSFR